MTFPTSKTVSWRIPTRERNSHPVSEKSVLPLARKVAASRGGARVITFTYLVNEKDGVVILLLLYDKADASNIKMNVVRQIIKDLGLDLQALQSEEKLKAADIKEDENESDK